MTSSKPSIAPAVKEDPNMPGLIEAERLIHAGQLQKAAMLLNKLQTQVMNDPRPHLIGIRLAEAAGQPQAALESARRAVAMAPQWGPAVADLALVLARQNQFAEAADRAREAVALSPGDLMVIESAINVAHRAGYAHLALELLPKAVELSAPRNTHFKRMWAQDLALVGKAGEAIGMFNELLKAQPDDRASLLGRAEAALASGDKATAQADWDKLVGLEPANEAFRFNQQLARGDLPGTQPASLPRELFDGMAGVYDQHMVRGLGYQLPKQVAEIILGKFPDRKANVLDLGCGTGLLGVCLGRLDGALVGVDVSPKMMALAARHQVYDRFHEVNLLDALEATPSDLYDVLAACDVFIYVGDLTKAIPDAHRIAKPGGWVIFSCERAQEDEADLVLRPSKRYAHKQSHVEALCKSAGFAEVTVQDTQLRLENGQPINGYLVIAQKGSAAEPAAKPKAPRKPRAPRKKPESGTEA